MKNKLSFLLVLLISFLTISAFANTSSTMNINKPTTSNDSETAFISSNKDQKSHVLLQKANLDEASLFQVAAIYPYPTCRDCQVNKNYCIANASNRHQLGICIQEYGDCIEICTTPWGF